MVFQLLATMGCYWLILAWIPPAVLAATTSHLTASGTATITPTLSDPASSVPSSPSITSAVSFPTATLLADRVVAEASGALVAVSNCDSTFVIQCVSQSICSLHGPATVTQGPNFFGNQFYINTVGGVAWYSASCSFTSTAGNVSCVGYTTVSGSGTNTAPTVTSSSYEIPVRLYELPLTLGGDLLGTPWSSCVSTATAATSPGGPGTPSNASKGLSTGAEAGIGVGVGVGGAIVLGAALFFFFRRRRQPQRERAHVDVDGPPTVDPIEKDPNDTRYELSGAPHLSELGAAQKTSELPGGGGYGVGSDVKESPKEAPDGLGETHELPAGDLPSRKFAATQHMHHHDL